LDTGELIGYCGLRPYKPSGKKYEMGILIKKNYWNRGYSVEAALAVIRYAFSILKASELIAVHNIIK
jgi:ribosomal-protein-alanine N-acetyltransferase